MTHGTEVWQCLNCGATEERPRQQGHVDWTFAEDLRCESVARRTHRCDDSTEGVMLLTALRDHAVVSKQGQPNKSPLQVTSLTATIESAGADQLKAAIRGLCKQFMTMPAGGTISVIAEATTIGNSELWGAFCDKDDEMIINPSGWERLLDSGECGAGYLLEGVRAARLARTGDSYTLHLTRDGHH